MSAGLISILLPDLRGGGAERVNLDLAREFAREERSVEFVLMQARGELLGEAQQNFSVVDLHARRARQLPFALARYLRQRRPYALLAAMWPLTVIAPLANRLVGNRSRVVVSEHNTLSVQYGPRGSAHRAAMRASMKFGYRLAHARVGVSAGVVSDLSALSGMSSAEFQVIYNPVPPRPAPGHDAIAAAEALWSTGRGARILTVGSFKAQKNHPLLLQAFARMDGPDARLMFVGTGAGESALSSQAQALGIADRVVFAGFHADPTPFYATADLFVLSSNYEGFGNVIVEALARGLPVVSTDCPSGPAEILENGRFGRLVPVRDEAALADAMTAALAQPHDREMLKARAHDFAPEKAAKAYLKLLGC